MIVKTQNYDSPKNCGSPKRCGSKYNNIIFNINKHIMINEWVLIQGWHQHIPFDHKHQFLQYPTARDCIQFHPDQFSSKAHSTSKVPQCRVDVLRPLENRCFAQEATYRGQNSSSEAENQTKMMHNNRISIYVIAGCKMTNKCDTSSQFTPTFQILSHGCKCPQKIINMQSCKLNNHQEGEEQKIGRSRISSCNKTPSVK